MTTLHFRGRLLPGFAMILLASCSNDPQPAPEPSSTPSAATSNAVTPDVATSAEPLAGQPSLSADTSSGQDATAASLPPSPTPRPSVSATAASAAMKPSSLPAHAIVAEKVAIAVASVPPASWTRCVVCHAAEKGAPSKLGPNLYGVYGQKMGQGSYAYSDALKASGLTLDEATLDKWLENPRALVPGNRMSFPGLKDPTKRSEIIAYLRQQR